MAITTTTAGSSSGFSSPANSDMDRSPLTNHLWVVCRTTTTQISIFKSTDLGVSWGAQGSFTVTGLVDLGEMRIDSAGDFIHMAYLANTSSRDRVYYRQIQISSGTADLSFAAIEVHNGGTSTPQSYLYSACVLPYKRKATEYAVLVGAGVRSSGTTGFKVFGVVSYNKTNTWIPWVKNQLIVSTRYWSRTGDDTQIATTMDIEHNGDGITASTPNVWLTGQILDRLYLVKFPWTGSSWSSPCSATLIATGRNAVPDNTGRWDGTRFVMSSPRPSTAQLDVFERNQSNTSTITRTSPSHPNGGTITSNTLTINHITQDFRLFATSSSGTQNIYYVDYFRGTDTWGSWNTVSGTVVFANWGARRGSQGLFQYDLYQESGTTPWTLSNVVMAVGGVPTAATWVFGTGTTPTVSGQAFDVTSSLRLDWLFNDPNPTDVQLKYALSRQIGAASIQYWRTSDSTWQSTEQQNTTATTEVTLTTGQWVGGGGAADLPHVYKVKTWDPANNPAVSYSDGLTIVPSTRVDPTLTSPTAAQILNAGQVVATWTVSEQSAYRVTVTDTTTSAIVNDTGFVTDAVALSYEVPVVLYDGFQGSLTLQTKNLEGLASVIRTVAFSVDYVEPVAPVISAIAAVPLLGGINVTVTQAGPSGAQPDTIAMDLWRRNVVSAVASNLNPFFEVDASDWTNSSYSTMVRSTAQFHSGVASLLLTPTGAAATPYARTTAAVTISGGTRWEARCWMRSTTANKTVRLYLHWYDGSDVFISSSTRDLTAVAGVWVWGYFAAASPISAAKVRLAIGQIGTPAAGDTLYVDDLELFPAGDDPGIRLVAGVVSGSTTLDFRAVSGVDYEYRGTAGAANGTFIYGPWRSA